MSTNNKSKELATKLLAAADVKVGGKRAQDIVVTDERFYKRAISQGSLGIGESYMDGWWRANKLDAFFYHVLSADLQTEVQSRVKRQIVWRVVLAHILNLQGGRRAYKNAQAHYDIGNDLYEPMLGKTMAYTCAYWDRGAKTLDQAQIDKFDLVCEKLGLKKGMKVLDPGCGWGGLSIHMARKYGCEVTCFTPAREQIAYIKAHAKGLKVIPILSTWQDYNAKTKFDRIASIGMLEHVGPKNYRKYLLKMNSILVDAFAHHRQKPFNSLYRSLDHQVYFSWWSATKC
jgi:cyclopropane-fatty-acyl-phospholipid synthase